MHYSIVIFIFYQIFGTVYGDGRILGGYRIDITKVPYTVHSKYHKEGGNLFSNCGGAILTKNLILTAGHCTIDGETGKQHIADRYTIRVGSTYKNQGGKTYKVIKVFTHPEYIGASNHYHHDVGILQLKGEIKFDKTSQPTQLANANDKIDVGGDTVVNGWGANPDHPDDTNHLYQVHLSVIKSTECAKDFADSSTEIATHEICVYGDRKNSCQGDSGGALVYTNTGRQIGIVSYGKKNCSEGFPSIFAKIQDNLNFINSVKRITENKVQTSVETDEPEC